MKSIALTVLAAAALAACGGGGSTADSGGSTTTPSLLMSGTAATGLALANANVEIKCATGSGTATTIADGTYSASITGGALPCMLEVTGTVNGTAVTLHSVSEAGTASGANTSAVANVTPLTEMIIAQLTGSLPSEAFAGFSQATSTQITTTALGNATTAVVTALKDSANIDLGAIDPFKAQLVAATSTAPTQGNQYDQLLDTLKTKVPTEALPQVVNQIATASQTSGDSAPITLTDVMTSVSKGSLANCPTAVSGKYRTIDYWGRTRVREFDFANMRVNRADTGAQLFTITADANQACHFSAAGSPDGDNIEMDFAMGPHGAGTYQLRNLTTAKSNVGYIFPVQAHPLSAITSTWNFQQSGYRPDDGLVQEFGKITFNSDASTVVCDHNPQNAWTCETDTDVTLTVAANADGGFSIKEGEVTAARLFGYRAPNGTLTLFGTTNPDGLKNDETTQVEETVIVAAKLAPLTLPAVSSDANKYWETQLTRINSVNSTSFDMDANTVTAVDSAAGTYSRVRTSDGRPDTLKINNPVTGLRHRDATTWNKPNAGTVNISATNQMPLPGLSMTITVNHNPVGTHFYTISVARP